MQAALVERGRLVLSALSFLQEPELAEKQALTRQELQGTRSGEVSYCHGDPDSHRATPGVLRLR